MITSLPVNSPDDVLQRNDMTAGLVSNPQTVSTETAVSSHHIYTSYKYCNVVFVIAKQSVCLYVCPSVC